MVYGKFHFGIGLIAGIVLATLFFHFYAPRYRTVESDDSIVRQDSWSGDSWRLVDNQWKKIETFSRDWKLIDQNLKTALDIPSKGIDREKTLEMLKSEYESLSALSNEEVMERIKIVYSREILINLYLSKFLQSRVNPIKTEDKVTK